jgi:hypothetical protein
LENKYIRVMKIGITINLGQHSIWSSGINQNAIYLSMLLNSINGFESIMIGQIPDNDNGSIKEVEAIQRAHGLKLIDLEKSYNIKFDVIIGLGLAVNGYMHSRYLSKNRNMKYVSYKCGNDFITDMETILFEAHGDRINIKNHDLPKPDQIWSIPQMENTNLDYYSFLLNQPKATVVPFVWEPIAIESFCTEINLSEYNKEPIQKIAVMEPNISVFKNCIFPIMVADKLYESLNLEKLILIGADRIKNNARFLNLIRRSRLAIDGKITADKRYPTGNVLKSMSNLVLSWQWENALNYLYLDIAWMGYPVIHNAHLCKDVGYYYEGFNVNEASNILQNAILNHANNADYLKHNRTIISRYTSKNKELVNQYAVLIKNLVEDKFIKYSYDSKNNSIYEN